MVIRRGPYKGKSEYGATTAAGLGADWQVIRAAVLARDDYICQYCGNPANTADHIIPRSKGGENSMENCVAACGSCNSSKRDRLAPRRRIAAPIKPRTRGWWDRK